jgi:hypothetical protein
MTAARKAALRKAQMASARARRRGKKVNRRKAAAGTAAVLATGGLFAYTMKMGKGSNRHPSTAVPTMSRNAKAAQATGPGMLTRQQRGLPMRRGRGRVGMVSMNRTKDAMSPYYQSRMNRGRNILVRGMKQAPPLRSSRLFFSTGLDGSTELRGRRTVRQFNSSYSPGAMGFPRNKRQQQAYMANQRRIANYSPYRAIPSASTVQY